MSNIILSERIQNLRKEKNLSQEEFGGILEVSRQSVSKWESGLAMPEIEKLIMINEIFGVTTDYLLKGNDSCQTVSSSGDNSEKSGDNSEKRGMPSHEVKGIVFAIKYLTIFSMVGLVGLSMQLFLMAIKPINPTTTIISSIFCGALFIVGIIYRTFLQVELAKTIPNYLLNKLSDSSYYKKLRIIWFGLITISYILFILTLVINEKILGLLFLLSLLAFAGFDIFTVFRKK